MKKQFNCLLFLMLFALTTAHAQLQKGTLVIQEGAANSNILGVRSGGLGNLTIVESLVIYSASPSLGYFLSKRFMLEGGLSLEGIGDGYGWSIFYGARTGARFFLNPENTKHNFFIEAQTNLLGTYIDGESSSQFSYGVGLGSTSFIAPGVSLDTRALFSGPLTDESSISPSNTLSFKTGLSFYMNPTMKSGRKKVVPVLQKGNWMIGGSNGSIDFTFDPSVFSISLLPRVGYFVTDKFVAGANLGVGFGRIDESFFGGASSTEITFAPLIRYYFGKNTRLRWYTGASLGLTYQNLNSNGVGESVTYIPASINGGFNLFLSPNFAFEVEPFLATALVLDEFYFEILTGGVNLGFNYFIR